MMKAKYYIEQSYGGSWIWTKDTKSADQTIESLSSLRSANPEHQFRAKKYNGS